MRRTIARKADGEVAWSRRPDAGANPQGSRAPGGTEANKPALRGEREVSRKTIAQGRPVCFRLNLWSYPVLLVARDPWVQSAPGFPCALWLKEGGKVTQSSDDPRRENA